ncbi:MAG TPA: DUF4173 domain-containing protein [Allosphingosinicella sp.]|jgi:hypothetical protein
MSPFTSRAGYSFWIKAAMALLLVVLGDLLFFRQWLGATLGLFAIAWLAGLLAAAPAAMRKQPSALAALAALAFALVMIEDPSPLAWGAFWCALSLAALLPRMARFGAASQMAVRLFLHGLSAIIAPWSDLNRLRRLRPSERRPRIRSLLPLLPLPLAGGALFVGLFSIANPLIANLFTAVELPPPNLDRVRIALWIALAGMVWASLRPRAGVTRPWDAHVIDRGPLPGVSVASVTLSLLLFNLIFAVQNGLDIAFLWSGARLPGAMTLAGYAHRGAYPLIATALLAGLFVLVTLRPGSETAARPLIRRLVVLWIGQNIFLVASSVLRTLDYIDAYSLTRLRIAALAWMLLVALGLALICWRMLKERSGTWLINTNAAAAAAMLSLATIVDLGAVAAHWNVRHAREVGGRGTHIDLCYLNQLGASAVLPLIELEARPLPPALRDRVAWVRIGAMDGLETRQADWHSWTWRNARRLAAARAAEPAPVTLPQAPFGRKCDGSVWTPLPVPYPAGTRSPSPALPSPAPAAPAEPRLTAEQGR